MVKAERAILVPLWLKLAYTAWIVARAPTYWIQYGPANFLWLCDLANFLVLAALWLESPLLVSSQAVSVLIIQVAWCIDYFGRLLLGLNVFGATAYMFTDEYPAAVRALSLFHLFMPPLLLWLVWRLGYDRRGLLLQTAVAWLVLPLCYLFTDPALNLNWLWRPFDREQPWLPPFAWMLVMLLAYPLVLYLPTHLALQAWAKQRRPGRPIEGTVRA
jgi:hypothetical protein